MTKTTATSKTTGNKKNLFTLFCVTLIDLIGFGMILPLIPYLGKSTSSSDLMVGLLVSIYSIMQFLFSPFWGGISDRYGRKPVLLVSIFGAATCHVLFAFSSTYWALFFTRMFAGLFSANISTAMASASDMSTEKNRTQTMGLIGAAFGLGFVLGPFLGAQGADIGKQIGFGDQFASLMAGVLSFLNVIFCFAFFKETLKEKSSKIKLHFNKLNPFSTVADTTPIIKLSVFLFFFSTFALALIEIVLFYAVKEQFNWDYKEAALGFAAIGLVMAFTQGGLIRPLKKRFSEYKLIVFGALIFIFGLQGAYVFSTLFSFGASVLILSFGYAILNPALTGFISLNAVKDQQGKTFGVTHGFSALSRIIGPLLGTHLLSLYGVKLPFLVSAASLGCALALFIYIAPQIKNSQKTI